MSDLVTLRGYEPTEDELSAHSDHDPKEDRWDDCPLCWADVASDAQRDLLVELGQSLLGNSIATTMGLRLRTKDEEMDDTLLAFAAELHQALIEDDHTIADEAWRALSDELRERVEATARRMHEDG